MNYVVYALVDPRDTTTRYIGMTKSPKDRLDAHLKMDPYNDKKTAWIQELKQHRMKPSMHLLAQGLTREQARDLEMRLIHEYLERGISLLNRDTKRHVSHWIQITGNQPILAYKVIRVQNSGWWVVGIIDKEQRLYRLRDNHKVYDVDASAYAMKDKLNDLLKQTEEQIKRDGAIIV